MTRNAVVPVEIETMTLVDRRVIEAVAAAAAAAAIAVEVTAAAVIVPVVVVVVMVKMAIETTMIKTVTKIEKNEIK